MKIITSKVLEDLNKQSKQYQFNRTLSDEFFKQLDPHGLHIIQIILFGHNGDSAEILHHRCQVLAKFKDSTEPVEVFLDVAGDTFNKLTTLKDVQWKEEASA